VGSEEATYFELGTGTYLRIRYLDRYEAQGNGPYGRSAPYLTHVQLATWVLEVVSIGTYDNNAILLLSGTAMFLKPGASQVPIFHIVIGKNTKFSIKPDVICDTQQEKNPRNTYDKRMSETEETGMATLYLLM